MEIDKKLTKFKTFLHKEIYLKDIFKNSFKFFLSNKLFILIIFLFFSLRIFNLKILPIFTDEALYLKWANMANFGYPYESLFDGKQPFLIWIFSFSDRFISDPLIAGRMVSVLFGFLSAITLYLISNKFFNKKVALLSFFLYTISPIFLFYDRMALMESALTFIGLFSVYLFTKNLQRINYLYSVECGVILGLGLYIKSSAIIFLGIIGIISVYLICFQPNKKQSIFNLLIIIFFTIFTIFPLALQPRSLDIIRLNSRYAFSIPELLNTPLSVWENNFQILSNTLFWQTSIIGFIFLLFYLFKFKKFTLEIKILITWFLLGALSFILLSKVSITRYFVYFIPLMFIFISDFLIELKNKKKFSLLLVLLALPLIYLSVLQLNSPLKYFSQYFQITKISSENYAGIPSGYGVEKTIDYLKSKENNNKRINIVTRNASGNPEDAIYIYFTNKKFTKYYVINSCNEAKNFQEHPTYFVVSNLNYPEFKNCLSLEKKFYKPDGKNYVGVYRIINPRNNSSSIN